MPYSPYVNAHRTKEQRRARYCFLRNMGLNRNLTRAIVGRTDNHIALSLENLPWSSLKTDYPKALYTKA